jgi:hypothetical protein
MRSRRVKTLWIGLVVIGLAAGAVAGLATRAHTYTVQQLTAHWRAPYDLVVLPKGVRAPVSGLVDPNSLDVGTGGISVAQYHRIARLPDVAVAAPLAPLGYLVIQIAYLELPPAPLLPDGFYRLTWQNRNQGLPNGQPQDLYVDNNGLALPPYAWQWVRGVSEDLYVVAVDPTAEARLMGLRDAVQDGHYFTPADNRPVLERITNPGLPPETVMGLPLLFTSVSPNVGQSAAWVERLTVSPAVERQLARRYPTLVHGPSYGYYRPHYPPGSLLSRLQGPVVERAAVPYALMWRDFLAGTFRHQAVPAFHGFAVNISPQSLQVVGPSYFVAAGPSRLVRTASPYPRTWPVAVRAVPAAGMVADWGTFGEPFRAVHNGAAYRALVIVPVGVYNPARLHVVDDPLTHLPLVGYRPEQGAEVVAATGRALNPPIPVLPDASPVGLWTAPPEALTTLGAAAPLLGPRPISSIRIKVAHLLPLTEGGEAQLQRVAAEITRATGLPVDIVRGASPEQILLHPGHLPGFARLGWIATDWVRLGTSVEILRQVSVSQAVMLGPVLVAAAVFAGISAGIGLAAERRRWAVALAVGVLPGTLTRRLLGQAAGQGVVVAGLACVTAVSVGGLPALALAVPVGLAAGLVVVGAMVPAVRAVARQDPLVGLKPAPPAAVARLRLRTAATLGLALAAASWRRTLLAAGALVLPAAVTYGVGLVELAWHNTLHVTVLGQYLLVHGGWVMTGAAGVTAGLTGVAAGEIAVAGAAWRQRTWAMGAALGWSARVSGTAMAVEAAGIGLVAGGLGAGVAAVGLSPLFGVPPVGWLYAATVFGVMVVSELAALPAMRAVWRQDPVPVLKGGSG